ncbi:MAG TPA: penicillin-binding protein 2 [Anaerolineaceae bacterium]
MNQKNNKVLFQPWRFWLIYALIAGVGGYYLFRLYNIQVIQGSKYTAKADDNRTREISTSTQRGNIFDRNNYLLAQNIASYNVVITPANLPGDPSVIPSDSGDIQRIYRELSALVGIPASQGIIDDASVKNFTPCATEFGIAQIVVIGDTNFPYDPIRIKCNVDAKTAMVVNEKTKEWPGVGIEIVPVRDYTTGNLTSEVIGFLGPISANVADYYKSLGFVINRDKIGFAGIEQSMQSELGGKNGKREVEVDVAGQVQRDLIPPVAPVPGNNIHLTIDTRLQNAARSALISEINYWNTILGKVQSTNGVVIAENPKTGEILAMVSYPNYENNRFAREISAYYYNQLKLDPNKPMFNQAISAENPPGSVYKMAAAIGALNEGVVTPDFQVDDPGKITILQKFYENDPGTPQPFYCWDRAGHGMVDFLHGVAWSCDVYFYKIGGGYQDQVPNGGLGPYRLPEYERALGYGKPTGVELTGEAKGLVPDPTWKRVNMGENWATGDTYIATIGQGFVLSTPIQVMQGFATIANDGKLMQPTLIHDITSPDGKVIRPFEPKLEWDITKDPLIQVYNGNVPTGEKKTVQPWVIQLTKVGLHMVVTEGTAKVEFAGDTTNSAGKTGTAEYCDNVAQAKNLCTPNNWPTHAWYVGYAPYDNPEIVVVAFVYNGGEGASVAAPIVHKVLDAYFQLKADDAAAGR